MHVMPSARTPVYVVALDHPLDGRLYRQRRPRSPSSITWAPPSGSPGGSVLPGAIAATAMWFLTTLAFGWYVTRFANYSQVYGSLGAGIALLFWLYIICLSILYGAEFNVQFHAHVHHHFNRFNPKRASAQLELPTAAQNLWSYHPASPRWLERHGKAIHEYFS